MAVRNTPLITERKKSLAEHLMLLAGNIKEYFIARRVVKSSKKANKKALADKQAQELAKNADLKEAENMLVELEESDNINNKSISSHRWGSIISLAFFIGFTFYIVPTLWSYIQNVDPGSIIDHWYEIKPLMWLLFIASCFGVMFSFISFVLGLQTLSKHIKKKYKLRNLLKKQTKNITFIRGNIKNKFK